MGEHVPWWGGKGTRIVVVGSGSGSVGVGVERGIGTREGRKEDHEDDRRKRGNINGICWNADSERPPRHAATPPEATGRTLERRLEAPVLAFSLIAQRPPAALLPARSHNRNRIIGEWNVRTIGPRSWIPGSLARMAESLNGRMAEPLLVARCDGRPDEGVRSTAGTQKRHLTWLSDYSSSQSRGVASQGRKTRIGLRPNTARRRAVRDGQRRAWFCL